MGNKDGNKLNHKKKTWICIWNLLFKINNHKGWDLNSYPRQKGLIKCMGKPSILVDNWLWDWIPKMDAIELDWSYPKQGQDKSRKLLGTKVIEWKQS